MLKDDCVVVSLAEVLVVHGLHFDLLHLAHQFVHERLRHQSQRQFVQFAQHQLQLAVIKVRFFFLQPALANPQRLRHQPRHLILFLFIHIHRRRCVRDARVLVARDLPLCVCAVSVEVAMKPEVVDGSEAFLHVGFVRREVEKRRQEQFHAAQEMSPRTQLGNCRQWQRLLRGLLGFVASAFARVHHLSL